MTFLDLIIHANDIKFHESSWHHESNDLRFSQSQVSSIITLASSVSSFNEASD